MIKRFYTLLALATIGGFALYWHYSVIKDHPFVTPFINTYSFATYAQDLSLTASLETNAGDPTVVTSLETNAQDPPFADSLETNAQDPLVAASLETKAQDPPFAADVLEVEAMIEPPPKTKPPKTKREDLPLPKRVFLRQTEESREGFGHVKNYTTLGILFAPEYKHGNFLHMADLRVNNINNLCKINTYGTNLGYVTRYIPKSSCWMWGLNAYWDYRQGSIAHWFQLGAGAELLGKYCDFRVNGYLPLEDKRKKSHTFEVGEDLFTKRIKFEYAYTGFNAELGWKAVRTRDFQLYLAGGPYYLSGNCDHKSWGGSFRVRPQYRDYVAVDLSMSDDSIFHLIYQIQVIFSLPLYRSKDKKPPCKIYNREIYQPVERWDLITLGRGTCWKSNFKTD